MKGNINHKHGSIYRIENIDIKDIVNLLGKLYHFSDTANLIIDTDKNEIYIEAPEEQVNDEEEKMLIDMINSEPIPPLDEVKMTDKMLEFLLRNNG